MMSQQLAATEYQKFFEDTPVALLRTDISSGKFIMANRFCAELLGYKNVEELFTQATTANLYDEKDYRKLLRTIKRQGFVRDYQIQLHLDCGEVIWASVSFHINCGGSCLEGTMTDITDTKEIEHELDQVKHDQLSRLASLNQKIEAVIDSYKSA